MSLYQIDPGNVPCVCFPGLLDSLQLQTSNREAHSKAMCMRCEVQCLYLGVKEILLHGCAIFNFFIVLHLCRTSQQFPPAPTFLSGFYIFYKLSNGSESLFK